MECEMTKPMQRELLKSEIERTDASSGLQEVPPAAHSELSGTDWNVQELLDRLEGDQEFFRELLLVFRNDSQASLQKAQRAMAEGNLEELSRAAHTIKGMLKNLSMNASGETAGALEKAACDGVAKESAELLSKLESALAKISPEVEAHLAEVKA